MKKVVRYLDIKPLYDDLFVVSDPIGICDDFIVNKMTLLLMFLFDGNRSDEEVRSEFIKRIGIFITEEQFKEIIEFFEKNGLFLDENLKIIKGRKIEELKKQGYISSYFSNDGIDLQDFIRFLRIDEVSGGNFDAAIVPHIDLRVGINSYVKAYDTLRSDRKRVFIFGVSHYFHEGLFSVCPLDWETPFGFVYTDKEAVVKITEKFSLDMYSNLLSYRKEHSIAFHLPYVKRLMEKARVVAILVGMSDNLKESKKRIEEFAYFIANNFPDSVFISSIDLSHVGNKFGDEKLEDPEEVDKEYINFLLSADAEGAFEFLLNNENKTRIDGILTNYLFLKTINFLKKERIDAKLLDYQKYFEKPTNSLVSFCSIVYDL